MQKKNLFAIAILTLILISTAFGQGNRNARNRAQSIQSPRDVASGQATGKRKVKPSTTNNAHDKYANQEVGYRQTNKRRRPAQIRPKNQDIEVENDETHRSQTVRTETVNNNESRQSKPVTNLGDTATHEVGHKGKRRKPQPTTPSYLKIEGIDGESIKGKQPNSAKYDGIDGESNDARTKRPNRRRKTQNLLPYMEQNNLKRQP